ncbi:hypothetical protein EJB05_57800, partial [Eragrostis curvula]
MSGHQRSNEEGARKKPKISKSSSKIDSEKVSREGSLQSSNAPAVAALPLKSSGGPIAPAKPSISYNAPTMVLFMDVIRKLPSRSQSSSAKNALDVAKDVISKSSSEPVKNVFSTSADDGKTSASKKAKIQDKSPAPCLDVSESAGLKAKIQDKILDKVQEKGPGASIKAKIQDKDGGEAAALGRLSPNSLSELRLMAANLGPLCDHSGSSFQMSPIFNIGVRLAPQQEEEFLPFDVTFDSAEVTVAPSLACDEVPPNTFVMIAQSLAVTHAFLRQYRELSHLKMTSEDEPRYPLSWVRMLRSSTAGLDFLPTSRMLSKPARFSDHIDDAFWTRASAIGQQPQDEF